MLCITQTVCVYLDTVRLIDLTHKLLGILMSTFCTLIEYNQLDLKTLFTFSAIAFSLSSSFVLHHIQFFNDIVQDEYK